jgi:hypothetical protein
MELELTKKQILDITGIKGYGTLSRIKLSEDYNDYKSKLLSLRTSRTNGGKEAKEASVDLKWVDTTVAGELREIRKVLMILVNKIETGKKGFW